MSGIYDDGARYGSEYVSTPSAREELLKRLSMAVGAYDSTRDNKLIDDLLHEEAEKIRNKRKNDEPMFPEEDQFMSGYGSGLDDGADLIDPYVK